MKNKYLVVLLFIAFLIRLYKISLIQCIATDGVAYVNAAKNIIEGKGFNIIWPPLYPLMISFLWKAGINPELSGQLISLIFGVSTVFLAYIIADAVFSRKIAYISAIFAAFHPYLVRYSAEVLTDSLFTFLITLIVFCGWQLMRKKKFIFVFVTGLLAGLAYLTKPEGIFVLVIISFWWAIGYKEVFYKKLARIISTWLIFLLISFPYLYAVKKDTGRWMISQKQSIVFSVALQEEGYADEFLNISPLEFAKEKPKQFFIKIGHGLITLLGRIPDAYHPLLFLFLIIGLFGGIKERKYLWYILSFLITFFIGYAIFHPGRRYLAGWVPLTLFISAFGVEKTEKRLGRKFGLAAVSAALLIMLPKTLAAERDGGKQWKEAGLWIKNKSGPAMKIMSDDMRTAFYADGEHIPWSETELNKADYIVTNQEIDSLKKVNQLSNKYRICIWKNIN